MVGWQLLHDHFCGWPVYEGVSLFGCVSVAYPPLLCDGVTDGVVEFGGGWVGEFGGTRPDLPLLPMDLVADGSWSCSVKVAALEVVPISLRQQVHLDVELGEAGEGVIAEVLVLVAFDVFSNPGDGGFLHEGPNCGA